MSSIERGFSDEILITPVCAHLGSEIWHETGSMTAFFSVAWWSFWFSYQPTPLCYLSLSSVDSLWASLAYLLCLLTISSSCQRFYPPPSASFWWVSYLSSVLVHRTFSPQTSSFSLSVISIASSCLILFVLASDLPWTLFKIRICAFIIFLAYLIPWKSFKISSIRC